MNNLFRTLVFDGQVSLTVADTTPIVADGQKMHLLSVPATLVFGKTLSAMTFMSACLKEETGEISLSVKTDGNAKEIAVSGNRALHIRGYIDEVGACGSEEEVFGKNGSLTIIRDDGYSRPFVGTCAFPEKGGVDEAFEEYYRISEQLPTRVKTAVRFDEYGRLVFAGVAVLQPLPFANAEALQKTRDTDLDALLTLAQEKGARRAAESLSPDYAVWEERNAKYQCNCSRQYLTRVLVSLGKAQMEQIIKEDGAVRIHCHYCNTDYQFTQEDADRIFPQNDGTDEV
ncbi:MAG: Hsp33 family molecular chaperone HslO [Clostridia bacterium]|nr:Hsp33 family molecular chaperone HslO [Clostridia bacterium]